MTYDNEFRRVQREVEDLRRAEGKPLSSIPEDADGWATPAAIPSEAGPGEVNDNHSPPSTGVGTARAAQDLGPPVSPQPDPGPPRIVAVDFDRRLAIMAGGVAADLTEQEVLQLATICLGAVQRGMGLALRSLAGAHSVPIIDSAPAAEIPPSPPKLVPHKRRR